MPDITMHLTANFYPPIPADIQMRVQEIFDELVRDSGPYIIGWKEYPEEWDYDVSDHTVFDREYTLPNGAVVTGASLIEDLRLTDALWWDCEEPDEFRDLDDDEYLDYSESQQIPGQLEMNYDSPV